MGAVRDRNRQGARWLGMGISLDKIEIYAPFRGHGHATAVMEQLIRFADANEYPLSLTPEAWWGSSVPRLRRFYERFGFRGREGRNKMHRRPRKLRRPST